MAIPTPTAKMRRKSHKAPDIVEQSAPSLVHAGRVYQLRAYFAARQPFQDFAKLRDP
jgi:hypothetical protein